MCYHTLTRLMCEAQQHWGVDHVIFNAVSHFRQMSTECALIVIVLGNVWIKYFIVKQQCPPFCRKGYTDNSVRSGICAFHGGVVKSQKTETANSIRSSTVTINCHHFFKFSFVSLLL
jgi:hypothetical protein